MDVESATARLWPAAYPGIRNLLREISTSRKAKCLACGYPHVISPDLVGWAAHEKYHCIWKKQPANEEELEAAIRVLESQDLKCHRYAGSDPAILDRVPSGLCDYPRDSADDSAVRLTRHFGDGVAVPSF